MPPKKTYTTKRKTYRKKRYNKKSTALRASPAFPIGKRFLFKTRYVELEGSITASSIAVSQVYCLNGLFDPNISGVGHQPIGFDQLMPLYDHYTVIGAKARLTMTNQSTTEDAIMVAQVKDIATTSTNTAEIIENGTNKYCVLTPEGTTGARKTLNIGVNISKFLGRSVMTEDTCRGTISANPTEQVLLHVHLDSPSTSSVTVRYILEIDYIAILHEPKQLAQS